MCGGGYESGREGVWGAFVKRVSRGYTYTQCTSTGDAPAIRDIPSSKKALKPIKKGCATPSRSG